MNQGIAGTPAWRTVRVWGLPLAAVTTEDVLDEIDRRVAANDPGYMITANLNYAMLSEDHAELDAINREAAIVMADGMPLLWAARWRGAALPERVAGSDLIFRIGERAGARGYRLFFLGGPPGVADTAARNMQAQYPGLVVVGVESPPYRELTETEQKAFGQPKGERLIHANYRALGVPCCIQLGASIDFMAGRISRAPKWMQRTGMEWLYRLYLEPTRLGGRYFRNALFMLRKIVMGDRPPAGPAQSRA
jgi:N-acetylglucosaminyldiphosphoundecaprenol N-acetyl-beta-D-mannosaminyltransferase